MTPEGSTHVDTFTGTTSSFPCTDFRRLALVAAVRVRHSAALRRMLPREPEVPIKVFAGPPFVGGGQFNAVPFHLLVSGYLQSCRAPKLHIADAARLAWVQTPESVDPRHVVADHPDRVRRQRDYRRPVVRHRLL